MSVTSVPNMSERDLPLFAEQLVSAAPSSEKANVRHALAQSRGPTGSFVELLRNACPTIRLSDLPIEVAQLILDNQAKTIQEFFDSWSESIKEQAKLDKAAAERAQMNAEAIKRSQGFLLSSLDRAVNLGQLSPEEAGRIQGDDVLAMRLAAGQPISELETAAPLAQHVDERCTAGLREPGLVGVSLRAHDD